MTDKDALYAAVLATPADDLPRPVFADWCDDHGDPDRAEFIRVQVELARLPADAPVRRTLEDRERELLTTVNRVRWGVPVAGGGLVQRFRRGFVDSVRTTAERFLETADDLFRSAPLRGLRLSVADGFVPQLCRVPWLADLHSLNLSGNMLGVGHQLERLLTDAPLGRLTELTVRDNRLFADAVGQITRSPVSDRLTHLNLSGNPLSDDGMAALSGATRLRELRSLTLRNDEQSYEDSVHAAGAAALAASLSFPRLERFDLTGHRVGDAGVRSLVGTPFACTLRELRLARNDIGEISDDWAEHLVHNLHPATRLLDLSGRRNRIGKMSADVLVGWPRLSQGLTLDLRWCDMDAVTHARLAASPFASHILLDLHPPEVSS